LFLALNQNPVKKKSKQGEGGAEEMGKREKFLAIIARIPYILAT
jgi:hypothetical protein